MKKKILIIKLGAIGDIVHTTVIASAIKTAHPDWTVHFITIRQLVDFLTNHPHIDNVIEWDNSKRKSCKYLWKIGSKLRKEKYDIIFNMTNVLRNNLLSYLALPKKIVNKKSFNKSWVEEYFLCAKSVIPELKLPEQLYLGVYENSLNKIKNDTQNYPRPHIIISPGGIANQHRQGRAWSIDKWSELADALKIFNGTVFAIGAEAEQKLHQGLKNTIVLTGNYTLTETCALISNSDLLISGDTGPAHIAAAYNINTLALLGSTTAEKIKPYGKTGFFIETPYPCKGCWRKKCKHVSKNAQTTPCMESITPQLILEKIREYKLL